MLSTTFHERLSEWQLNLQVHIAERVEVDAKAIETADQAIVAWDRVALAREIAALPTTNASARAESWITINKLRKDAQGFTSTHNETVRLAVKRETKRFVGFFPKPKPVRRRKASLTLPTKSPSFPGFDRLNMRHPRVLAEIKGIGPALAQRIVEARPIKTAEALYSVKGLSRVAADRLIAAE